VSATTAPRPETIRAIPVRHPWRWVAAVLAVLLAAAAAYIVATAPDLRWPVVQHYLFQGRVLEGAVGTIELTVLAMVIGISLGVLVGVMRLSTNPVMSAVSWVYIWFFRGTPVLVQLFFWWNLPLILPTIGIPGHEIQTVDYINSFLASILGLGLNEAAYMSEIVRAGIISVESGQTEAAMALGMPRSMILRRIVLPQAMRFIIPPTGNETISMLKTSSLAFITQFHELFRVATEISAFNYRIVELLIVISVWYLFFTSVLTIGQYYLERYFARGSLRDLPLTPLQRFQRMALTFHAGANVTVFPPRRDDSGQAM
jgi:polar amino acid transport system permease protein